MRPSSTEPGSGERAGPRITIRHLFVLVPIAAVAWRAGGELSDNSFLWHVRAGTLQLEAGEVVRADPFSFTAHGERWRTQSWLMEIGYGWAENVVGSLQWAPVFVFLAMATTLTFVAIAAYGVTKDAGLMAVVVTVVAVVSMLFVVPRPVVASYLLLAVVVVVLRHPRRLLWTLIPLMWLWASLHGLFVLGLLLVGLEAVRRRSASLFGVGIAAGAATLATAHGVGVLQILADFIDNREALSYLSEWMRPDFFSVNLIPGLVVGAALVVAFVQRKLAPVDLAVVVPFAVLGATQLRSVFPAMLVLAPMAAVLLAGGSPRRRVSPGNEVVNLAIAGTIVLLAGVSFIRPVTRDTKTLPSAAAVAALRDPEVFSGPGAGGLLIWSEYPRRRVFLDDRAELYGAELFGDFLASQNGETGAELLDRFGIDEALVHASWPLGGVLEGEGWQVTHRDERWVVLVRP